MAYQTYPPPFQAPYYPPPPPPPVDPFRAYYAGRLTELTFNSRPIIQDMSVIAMTQRDQNNWEGMRAVVEEIESAVLRAPPHQKLPLLYLIDSISKNIGPPYTTHLLPSIVPRLYLATYREVDGVTKAKMAEMIGLWRTSGIDGGDLYGPGLRESIERDIFGSMGYQRQALPTRDRVLSTLHTTLEAKHRESAAQPWNRAAAQQVGVLVQIGELLNTTQVSPHELGQIMEQLKSMAPVQTLQPPPVFSPIPQAPPASAMIRPPAPNLPPFPPHLQRDEYGPPPRPPQMGPFPTPPPVSRKPLPGPTPYLSAPNPVQTPASLLSGIPANVADILRNLNTSGIISHPRTPELQSGKLGPKSGHEAYEDMIISLDVRLESLDLNQIHTLPTSHMPQRCKQCGIRFPEGDTKMQAHMDWHFRRNRKERESGGRGSHRRWLPRAEVSVAGKIGADWQEWINETASAEAGPSHSPTKAQSGDQGPAKLTAERTATLQRRWVRVPSDSSKAATPCPICKEAFRSEWSEEEEEWVWRNAVDINGTIYHATCRAEQMSSAVAARLLATEPRARSASRSPRGTPQPDLPKVEPSPMKRKAEDEENEAKRVKVEPEEEEEEKVETRRVDEAAPSQPDHPDVAPQQSSNPAEIQMKMAGDEIMAEEPPLEHSIKVIPPTPASGARVAEGDGAVELGEEITDGEAEKIIKDGTEEREFEPDLEVELDPEPEEG